MPPGPNRRASAVFSPGPDAPTGNPCSESPARRDYSCGMRDDQHRFLSVAGQLPARLTAEQAAWMLGCQMHDMPILVASRLLKPLGNPPPNGIKFFATADLVEHAKDRSWLTRMTVAITNHWKGQNGRKRGVLCDADKQLTCHL